MPLPLGWMLSGGAAIEMRQQLRDNDDNQESKEAVISALIGTSPAP